MRRSALFLQVLTLVVALGILLTWAQAGSIMNGEPTGTVHLGMGLAAVGACLAVAGQVTRGRPER